VDSRRKKKDLVLRGGCGERSIDSRRVLESQRRGSVVAAPKSPTRFRKSPLPRFCTAA
jgi:hypothetical protein